MIRVKISGFIKKYKHKIYDVIRKLTIVAMIVFIATIAMSIFNSFESGENIDATNVYKPQDTVIKGSNISDKQYEQDSNLVNDFIKYCNNNDIEKAYGLLSDECKEELYPTIQDFEKYYFNHIFDKKRECNLQSWISNSKYTVYKVRYTNDMLSTGTYDENDVYQDYLTLNKKNDEKKISIGNFIDSEECNIITSTNGIQAIVTKKRIYLEEEQYDIYVKNNTDKTILLDNLKTNKTIWLIANGIQYRPYTNKLFVSNLTIEPGQTNKIQIKVIKNLSSENKSQNIQFKQVIKDYNTYIENEDTYNDYVEIKIKVED